MRMVLSRRVVAGLVIVTAAFALAGGTAASPSRFASLSGRIAFEESSTPCAGHCRVHITVMSADGSRRKMLTTNGYGEDLSPRWSPNGREILFTRQARPGSGLEVMNANGTGVRLLVRDHAAVLSDVNWSANGTSALYLKGFSSQRCPTCLTVTRFGLMSVTTTRRPKPHRLFMLPGGAHPLTVWSLPSESPDGKWVVVERMRFLSGSDPVDVWLVHPNGKGLHRLLQLNDSTRAFAWSPDSKQLAYVGLFPQWQSGCPNEDPETDAFWTVFVVGVGGGTPRPMWNFQCGSSPAPTDFVADTGYTSISWAPDGHHIVYATTDVTPPNEHTPANEVKFPLILHVVDTETGEITGVPNSRQSSDNCHGGGGSADVPCGLVDPSWTH